MGSAFFIVTSTENAPDFSNREVMAFRKPESMGNGNFKYILVSLIQMALKEE